MSTVNGTSAADVLSQYRSQDSSSTKSTSDMGKNEFMELMIAQLNNQNPLKPQENGDFLAQLAQFSSLEEMQGISDSVQDVAGQFRSTQALQASAMVGRTVMVPSQTAILGASGEVKGSVEVPAATSSLRVDVLNTSGELVRQLDLGSATAGQKSFSWDGKDANGNDLPEGTYQLKANAGYTSGTEQLGTMISANVDSVSLGTSGKVTLNLAGMGSVGLSDVRQIN
ncbi:flagellar hook assembly protein FlgD [Marinobacter halodurans]|uniref:Basal-body rod modification protein FlgD n=1 Tax=Marinobacter halodurans TaxID=2528979 RepID=A0ABY1ZS23_9GAMM|nr:flagellar hook assembly protein FlgD [Marinobacter halodurans]TBW59089.1 flagellar hook assembly protein FlgD [Marinobacter halodurans]